MEISSTDGNDSKSEGVSHWDGLFESLRPDLFGEAKATAIRHAIRQSVLKGFIMLWSLMLEQIN